jgi:predicted metal-dependent hydrolase
MQLDWTVGSLAEGLACYNRAEFFETHEHWETVWLTLPEPEKSFLQALIQMTAAFHHLQSGNRIGTVSLLKRTSRRLAACPETFGGIDVAALRREISAWIAAIEAGASDVPEAPPQVKLACA